ncbi:serine/threonine-protein kinase HipA [Rhizobium mongolense]|uniref:Serine/threonine-protein kinase HipA n=1 Tax=Rhizobium mongolense TaxID=57676 RepID=A0ABR6IX14_9HYPH|nr:serine/threonine-protein kinase HipA [Rhizobium mongolense]
MAKKEPAILGVHLLDHARKPVRVGTLTRDGDGGVAFSVAEPYLRHPAP